MQTADFDYTLPAELIAQNPVPERDESRLLVLNRGEGEIRHQRFRDLAGFLNRGDLLVLNNSRVIPARLRGVNLKTIGRFELFLLEENAPNDWWVMMRPGKRGAPGAAIGLLDGTGTVTGIQARVIGVNEEGHRRVCFSGCENILSELDRLGEVPLPPYIRRAAGTAHKDKERYQTVFAARDGSVAAPTAGLHFTDGCLEEIRQRGIGVAFVTLHVGLGTFAPVKAERLSEHVMHEERYEMPLETAKAIERTKRAGRRIVAVGTTSMRVLESHALGTEGSISSGSGRTRIFIYPPFCFRVVDALLTNFHLPRSTLLMLVSAFAAPESTAGIEMVKGAYMEAIGERYRFFSYGDAMLVI